MKRTILSVAYPLAPVGPDAVGGAEQVLYQLDAALTQAGHQSIVVACAGSRVHGTLLATPRAQGELSAARPAAWIAHRQALAQALARWDVDLIHMHGIDFDCYLPPPELPLVVTLHLPPDWYSPAAFQLYRPHLRLVCVSRAQWRAAGPLEALNPMTVIENGVPEELLGVRHARRRFVLALGRICPEKGFHLALNAAARAGRPMLLAGEVYPYEAHQRYFTEQIVPRLDRARRFIGPLDFARKRRLLGAAHCLLVPSLAPETSSLVAMEALACGTPVIAFPAGALPELIEHGRTGFLVHDENEMADAIEAAGALDPELCRAAARRRFSWARMTGEYLALYENLIAASAEGRAHAA